MSKKSKKIDQQIDSINQINLTNKIVFLPPQLPDYVCISFVLTLLPVDLLSSS